MVKLIFNLRNAIIEVFSPDKRMTNTLILSYSLFDALDWCKSLMFDSYINGLSNPYIENSTYPYMARVTYLGYVFASLKDNNTDLPTNKTSWKLVQVDHVGTTEQLERANSKICFEYAINREFLTTFVNPPYTVGNHNPIYVTNLSPAFDQFTVSQTEYHSSAVGETESSEYVGKTSSNTGIHFTVNVPTATANTYGQDKIRYFIEKLKPIGLSYTLTIY